MLVAPLATTLASSPVSITSCFSPLPLTPLLEGRLSSWILIYAAQINFSVVPASITFFSTLEYSNCFFLSIRHKPFLPPFATCPAYRVTSWLWPCKTQVTKGCWTSVSRESLVTLQKKHERRVLATEPARHQQDLPLRLWVHKSLTDKEKVRHAHPQVRRQGQRWREGN